MNSFKILIVEDEILTAKDIQNKLIDFGYPTSSIASSGEEAIKKADGLHPDLILMDIGLHGNIDGIDAAQEIRSKFNIPVIFLTAYSDEETLKRSIKSEPFGYVLKPIDDKNLHITIDIALARYKLEIKMRANEKWLATTLNNISDAVISTDSNEKITFINHVAENLTGWSLEEAKGVLIKDIFNIVDEKTGAALESQVSKIISEKDILCSSNSILISKDNRKIPIENRRAPLYDDNGEVIGAILVFRDISEIKHAEEEKSKIQAQLLQSQKMEAVGTLAGGIAHDFNNLITAIRLDIALIQADEEDSYYKNLKRIEHTALRAADLASQLLIFSRKQPMEPELINPNDTVESLLKMVMRLIGEDINVTSELDPNLWTIMADEGKIEQVIMNLVLNSRDAMPDGGILTIKTSNIIIDKEFCETFPYACPGDYICITISDDGIGMDEETLHRIFDPFFTTKGVGHGTGLGLAVVYGIVKQHRGCIIAKSNPGTGSQFMVYLPVSTKDVNKAASKNESLHTLQGNGEQILIVEDESEILDIASTVLRQNGYDVTEAATTQEAIEIFDAKHGAIQLVFSDVVLPDKSGIKLVEELLTKKKDLLVLLSSGYTDQKSQWQIIKEKNYNYLQKPYSLPDLLHAVKRAFEKV